MFSMVETQGFPGISDGKYRLGLMNRIAGPNGCGKSSLFRAILWALTGLCQDGSEAGSYYGDASVTVVLLDGSRITRVRSAKKTSIKRNDTVVTQEMLDKAHNIPPRALLCVLFPLSFMSLTETQQRDLFYQITPNVSRESIFAKRVLGKHEIDWSLPSKKLHEMYGMARKLAEKELDFISGRMNEITKSLDNATECEEISTDDIEQQIKDIQARRAEISHKIEEINVKIKAFEDYKSSMLVYERQKSARIAFDNLREKSLAPTQEDVEKIKDEMSSVLDKLNKAKANQSETESEGKAISSEIQAISSKPSECPTCGRPFEHAKNEQENKDKLEKLSKKRAEIAAKYKKHQKDVDNFTASFGDLQKKYKTALDDMYKLAPPQVPDLPEQPDDIDKQKEILQQRKDLQTAADSLVERTGELKAKLSAPKAKTKKEIIDTIKKIEVEKKGMESKLAQMMMIEELFHPVRGIDSECLRIKLSQINLQNFSFEFSETLGNGNERECFRVLRSDGVCLHDLSSGQKIKFGLSLSELIARLTKTQLRSVYVECADVVDAIAMLPDYQISVERVDKSMPNLVVEIKKEFLT